MKTYTPQELKEIIAWYEANADRLPATAQLGKGETVRDMPQFVSHTLSIVRKHAEDLSFARQIKYLFILKEQIEKQGGLT